MADFHWLASYPKSGNTWLRLFIANLATEGDQPVRINELQTGTIAADRAWLDDALGFSCAEMSFDELDRLRPAAYRWAAATSGPCHHKVHDAWVTTAGGEPLLGDGDAFDAVYILRNPLDVASSLANHLGVDVDTAIRHMGDPAFALAASVRRLSSQTRQRLLSWSEHVLSWVDAAAMRRLVIRYEDMLAEPAGTFGRVAAFLGLPCDPARVARAVAHCSFSELSRQESVDGFRERPHRSSRFFRRGGGGHWRDELRPEQVARIVADHEVVMGRFGYLPGATATGGQVDFGSKSGTP